MVKKISSYFIPVAVKFDASNFRVWNKGKVESGRARFGQTRD
jgi:hypothetical protein